MSSIKKKMRIITSINYVRRSLCTILEMLGEMSNSEFNSFYALRGRKEQIKKLCQNITYGYIQVMVVCYINNYLL